MDKEIAEILIDELGRHSEMIVPDRELFLEILLKTNVPESSKFYEILHDKQQLLEETNRYHYFSLRRILRNRNARDYQLSKWKQTYEAVASALGIYSSDVLSRKLRSDKDLVGIMEESKHPFSLLAKLQTYDFDNPDETLFIITRPVLIIPDARDTKKILDWEKTNTTYEKEVGILFRHPKRIKVVEYYALQ